MVFKLQFWRRYRVETLISPVRGRRFLSLRKGWAGVACVAGLLLLGDTWASEDEGTAGVNSLREAAQLYEAGQYFKSARYAYAAMEQDSRLKPDAYAWMTLGLMHAGLPNAASYFFIRTLQTGQKAAIRSVLTQTQDLLVEVGADILRKYLIRHTRYEDYNAANLSAYLYALGKDAILLDDPTRAIGYLNGMREDSPLWSFGLQLRGTAHALIDQNEAALADFRKCTSMAKRSESYRASYRGTDPRRIRQAEQESEDLMSRCLAGEARVLYQMNRFAEADRVYDRIPRRSYVWTDILFEQAWSAFAQEEWNRSLGKLVSYKSPALSFIFNPEIEVLQAQSYLALCLYADVNDVLASFQSRYTAAGVEIKEFVEARSQQVPAFYSFGKDVLKSSLYSSREVQRLANRFIRGPYFQNLVATEARLSTETAAIRRFDSLPGISRSLGGGFPGFLDQVLRWRLKTVQFLGGAFVKNSLLDYHAALIDDYEKMSFIKLDLLKRSKDQLLPKKSRVEDRSRGGREPSRRDDQYYWSFNGEFWEDELGGYVFGLESECKG